MPHPNRFQSSPKFPYSQGLDTCLPFNSPSMPHTQPSSYHASISRLGSRRARPSVASVADVFVSSLVMASFCREHSPRGRGLSTMSAKAPNNSRARWNERCVERTRQLSPKKRPAFMGSSAECLGVHRSRTQRLFNSGVVKKLDDDDNGDNYMLGSSEERPSLRTHRKDAEASRSEYLRDQLPKKQQQRTAQESSNQSSAEGAGSFTELTYPTSSTSSLERLPDHTTISSHESRRIRYYGKSSPTKELYKFTSKLYRVAFGESLDWKKATDTVVNDALPPAKPRNNSTPRNDTQNPDESEAVASFLEAMWDEKKSNQYVFRLYRELPHPGIALLSKSSRGALLRRFANPTNRRWVDARRYLGLVEDMIAAKLPLSRSLWTSAIHMAGRASGKVFKRDLVRAIGIWQQMEHLGGVKSDHVVFGILFDIAIKAGQFTVAARLLDEMKKRDITFSRNGKVSLIYYYGMLHDADGIRQTFDDFVTSGEIVDTAVLNCLLVSFIRAGELKTAEQLYHRMMIQAQVTAHKTGGPNQEQGFLHQPSLTSEFIIYRKKSRKLNRVLQMSASLKDRLPEHHRALQESLPMSPDTRTFHIFLSFHAYQSGNLHAFMSILEDMETTFAIPPRGMIYLLLFEGFARHGRSKKGWTAERLRAAWKTYLRALYESKTRLNDRLHIRAPTLIWENPLATSATAFTSRLSISTHGSSGLYTPLPSANTEVNHTIGKDGNEQMRENKQSDEGEDELPAESRTAELDVDVDVDELFKNRPQDRQAVQDGLEELERQIENGVFLGRRMIIILLRAFGTCCGPKEVMEVWLQIERIWQPQKRKALDVQAIKEELEKQMNNGRRQY